MVGNGQPGTAVALRGRPLTRAVERP